MSESNRTPWIAAIGGGIVGAALTAGWAMWSGQEPTSIVRVLLLVGIVGCVVGLKLTP